MADEPGKLLDSTAWNWNDLAAKKTDVGERRDVVHQPTRTLDELEMHITTLNPHTASHPPHTHPNEEMVIVKEGTLQAHVNGKEVVVPAGRRAVLRLDAAARGAEHRRHARHLLRDQLGEPRHQDEEDSADAGAVDGAVVSYGGGCAAWRSCRCRRRSSIRCRSSGVAFCQRSRSRWRCSGVSFLKR